MPEPLIRHGFERVLTEGHDYYYVQTFTKEDFFSDSRTVHRNACIASVGTGTGTDYL